MCSCGKAHSSDEESGADGKKKPSNKRPPSSSSGSSSHSDHSDSDSESASESEDENIRFKLALEELKRKQEHPARLHQDLWFNEKDQMNDGPVCRCSWKARQNGIRHYNFAGEQRVEECEQNSNNADRLYHYVMKVAPLTNIHTKLSSAVYHDDHEYVFDGFSLFSHRPLPEKLPVCRVLRWNIEYRITFLKEEPPEAFTVRDCELFWEYFFVGLLDMYDVSRRARDVAEGCPIFHLYPRFIRRLQDNGKELLCLSSVLSYLRSQWKPLISPDLLSSLHNLNLQEWQQFVDSLKGQLVANPNKRPCCVRMDQMDREGTDSGADVSCVEPVLVHFGSRPSILTYAGNPDYQKAWKQYVKLRHLMMMKETLTREDKTKLQQKEAALQRMKSSANQKRDVTAEVSTEGFHRTGLYPDIVQYGLMALAACSHVRFHWSLDVFEHHISRPFKNRALLELAFTHPSYRTNYGTNPDHVRNTLSNCGVRQPQYGKRELRQVLTRKRGINTLIDIMSRMGSRKAKQSHVMNNERLEYLGDAVIEFLSTIHLFFMFPNLEEGGLATYRSSLVQNKHLAVLAKKLGLDNYMLYAHGPDLCHDADLRHAMANAFEAVMGALFLDGGLDEVDRVFAETLFPPNKVPDLHSVWTQMQNHPLQTQEPNGDRHWVETVETLGKLTGFEKRTGIDFTHIRLLAKAFTRRNVGYNLLTLGHNQRLEFLGDTVLQLITSEFLYKHFPEHHEGHLSLLRSCLVNNKTQAVICDDLGLTEFVVQPVALTKNPPPDLRLKDKADLVEALLGALYVDQGLKPCKIFCKVCFYPRLSYFIISQRWNDPKSQLQQCCLTLRSPDGGEPDIPQYKVILQEGPTNTREYEVAVYFRQSRLATGRGHSIQEAEMRAAEAALRSSAHLFPYLQRQRNFVRRRLGANQSRSPQKRALEVARRRAGLHAAKDQLF